VKILALRVSIIVFRLHDPQTSTLWPGVGEVSSAGEVGC